jgi:hypothetical protein
MVSLWRISCLTRVHWKKFGPEVVKQLSDRVVQKAVLTSLTVRVDTTVVGANMHHPTDQVFCWMAKRKITRVVKKLVDCAFR